MVMGDLLKKDVVHRSETIKWEEMQVVAKNEENQNRWKVDALHLEGGRVLVEQ
jgi:hypothetical protein